MISCSSCLSILGEGKLLSVNPQHGLTLDIARDCDLRHHCNQRFIWSYLIEANGTVEPGTQACATATTDFYENAVQSVERPAAIMMASIRRRNISGSSRNRFAMKAPAINEAPAIRPCSAISGGSAPRR